MKEYMRYPIVWKPFPASVGFVAASGSPGTLTIPLFLEGEDLETFEKDGGFTFTPFNVLRGILIGLQQNAPTIDLPATRPFLVSGLNLLPGEFEAKTLEDLILSCAVHIFENNGPQPSLIALRTGRELFPDSHKIKSDMVNSYWRIAVDTDDIEVLQEAFPLGLEIDPAELDENAAPILVYFVFVSVFNHADEAVATKYFNTYVNEYVPDGSMRDRLERLRRGDFLSLAELDE